MAPNTGTVIRSVSALTLAVCVDLFLFYASGLAVPHSLSGHVARLWVSAALRWSALTVVLLLTSGGPRPVLLRLLAAYSLLPAMLASGAAALRGEPGPCAAAQDARCWLSCAGASLAAALFWELFVPDSEEAEGAKQEARVLFMRVLHLFRPDRVLLLGGLLFLSLAVICEMFIPIYTGRVIDILRSRYQPDHFLSALLFMSLFSLGSSLCAGCRGGLLLCAIGTFTCRIKVKLFGALTKQEVGFFESIKTGELTSRLSKDTKLMGMTVCLNVNVLLRTLVKTLGMIFLMVNLSWTLTLLVLMETPITGLIQKLYDTHYQRLSLAMQDAMARANEAANEVVSGIRVVRSFRTERHEARRYGDRLTDTTSLKNRRDAVRIVYLLARRLTGLAMQVLMLYYGRLFIQRGQMTTGALVSFILYQSDLGDNIRTLFHIFGDMLNSVGAAGKVFEYLDRKPEVSFDGHVKPDRLRGHVRFQHLNFAYPSNPDKAVLQDLCLELRPGQVTALVGPSGEGKSTCVSLLKRLYELRDGEGEILLDDQPLKAYDHRYFHQQVAVVSQEPVLFSGSIRDNIAYGLTDCSLEDVQDAARRANAHDFITRLQRGYDTEVGEGGGQLSRSERQQVAIARALLRRPQVLILDEITSCLDSESENRVQQALADWPHQTLLVIAHKLKTIERAHQIAVISGGRVEERGTHQELMELKGTYYRLREESPAR